jgi:hypothetical protein
MNSKRTTLHNLLVEGDIKNSGLAVMLCAVVPEPRHFLAEQIVDHCSDEEVDRLLQRIAEGSPVV